MSLNETLEGAVHKKTVLFTDDHPRYLVRSVLAGAFLALGTAFAGVAGNAVEQAVPGLGSLTFALLFGLGLFCIIILNAELATGTMMFMSFGVERRWLGAGKALGVIALTTIYNLIGVILIAAGLAASAKFSNFDAGHLIATLSEGKLEKSPGGIFVEAIMANFVVNIGIVGALMAKDIVSKFFVIVPVIAIFVGLGLEHVIANFSLMSIDIAASGGESGEFYGAVGINWIIAWVGNIIGGGVLIGMVYSWLNRGNEAYRD